MVTRFEAGTVLIAVSCKNHPILRLQIELPSGSYTQAALIHFWWQDKCVCVCVWQVASVVSDSLQPYGL